MSKQDFVQKGSTIDVKCDEKPLIDYHPLINKSYTAEIKFTNNEFKMIVENIWGKSKEIIDGLNLVYEAAPERLIDYNVKYVNQKPVVLRPIGKRYELKEWILTRVKHLNPDNIEVNAMQDELIWNVSEVKNTRSLEKLNELQSQYSEMLSKSKENQYESKKLGKSELSAGLNNQYEDSLDKILYLMDKIYLKDGITYDKSTYWWWDY